VATETKRKYNNAISFAGPVEIPQHENPLPNKVAIYSCPIAKLAFSSGASFITETGVLSAQGIKFIVFSVILTTLPTHLPL
jgi:hypothetical protein